MLVFVKHLPHFVSSLARFDVQLKGCHCSERERERDIHVASSLLYNRSEVFLYRISGVEEKGLFVWYRASPALRHVWVPLQCLYCNLHYMSFYSNSITSPSIWGMGFNHHGYIMRSVRCSAQCQTVCVCHVFTGAIWKHALQPCFNKVLTTRGLIKVVQDTWHLISKEDMWLIWSISTVRVG